ncbi:MAG TPA: transglycosylase SLT domain-containing protein [Verrucomicrobiae bacterium]|nr:transglycosylase SLT domain-containing protein [Verrucomicrobiae bacterium]
MPRPVLALFLLLSCGNALAADAPAPVRDEFRAAMDAIGQPAKAPDSEALRHYLLYPYVATARLRQDLARVPDRQRSARIEARVRALLVRENGEPVARELRREWLGYLAERALWDEFLAAAPQDPLELPTLALSCHAIAARRAKGRMEGLRDIAVDLWLDEKNTPAACASVFRWVDSAEQLTPAEVEWRARFAARERLPPPAALASLAPARRMLMAYWDRMMAQPERELRLYGSGERPDGLALLPDPDTAEVLLEGFTRVSRRDSRQSRLLYESLRALPFDTLQRGRLQRDHALGLAYDFDLGALEHFRDIPDLLMDSTAYEWRVRAALLHRQWFWARRWIEAMPEDLRAQPRWQYWLARAMERRQRDKAHAIYALVAKEREYHAFLAAERLGRKPDMRPVSLTPDTGAQEALLALPAVQRARELFLAELPALAGTELRHALRDRTEADKLQAALLVARWGWFEPAVRIVSELQSWDDLELRFPLPWTPAVEAAATASGVPADWLYAVLRTESLYDPRAVSRVGALGLLQLMLPTARTVARDAGMPRPERDDLFQPELNLSLGSRYLSQMLERFNGRLILALAAYNAGPHKVPDWLPETPVEADIWIENIPYNETRAYVQRALSSLVILSWRRSGQAATLAPLLQPVVAPRQDASP